ncbi:MAG: methylated-DNA--[protein]-cysteine S-methyltransferase [Deltaproteobacteria bacterium]|nr:methylated-DNA--[protein]-cysteine S-methyltransferase [Deltaproteobacteria bacterium]
MMAGLTSRGLSMLSFLEDSEHSIEDIDVKQRWSGQSKFGKHDFITILKGQLDEYFRGERQIFSLPLDLYGTEFQCNVWRALLKIPYGVCCSYQEQAKRLGKPKAIRAVANANRQNRIAIIVPCHRVIGKNGELTGYRAGLWRKQQLIALERNVQK